MSMAVFLKDFKRGGGGHGAYRRREYAVESNGISSEAVAIDIEDKKHFPCLSPLAKAWWLSDHTLVSSSTPY